MDIPVLSVWQTEVDMTKDSGLGSARYCTTGSFRNVGFGVVLLGPIDLMDEGSYVYRSMWLPLGGTIWIRREGAPA